MQTLRKFILATLVFALVSPISNSDAAQQIMTNERLGEIIKRLDENVKGDSGYWQAAVGERSFIVITDQAADRMRIISPIVKADELDAKLMLRMLQANFDTALDARYSIAKGVLWSVYIHPLGSLTDKQFVTGIGQVINLAKTYGSTFSSGALTFGGGDSSELIQQLLEKGLSI